MGSRLERTGSPRGGSFTPPARNRFSPLPSWAFIVYAMSMPSGKEPWPQQNDVNEREGLVKVFLADGTIKTIEAKPMRPVAAQHARNRRREEETEKLFSSDARVQAANSRRSKFIHLISEGMRAEEACREIGISTTTYYTWSHKYPNFRDQVHLARQNWSARWHGSEDGGWRDFSEFRKRFFRFDTYPLHLQIIDAIEQTKPMEVTLILVAPETGKTTLLEDKICETLGKDPDRRIAYISESIGHARKVGSRIRRRMTDRVDFGDYISKYGPFYEDGQERSGKVWSADHFTVYKAGHDERDYSFEARGAKSQIQGSRIDDMYIDDVQSLKSLDQTEKIVDMFRQEWIPRVKKGRIVIIMTRVGKGDFAERVIELDLVDHLVEVPILDPNGRSVIPELWSEDQLAQRKKKVGPEIWARTYMQDPISESNKTFTNDVLEGFKDYARVIEKKNEALTIMSLDPGLSGGNCLTVAQLWPTRLEVVDQIADYGLGRTEGILRRVNEFAAKYRPSDFIIEMMAFQQALGKDDRMLALAQKYGFRIYPHQTGDNKYDSFFGVGSMATSMRAQEMTIPWGDDQAQETFHPLLDEMQAWKPHVRGTRLRQDRIMSLWFIHLYWMNQRKVIDFQVKKEVIRARSLPWKPTSMRRLGR